MKMKLEPVDTLRHPTSPKPGWIVAFRPTGKDLGGALTDVSYWRRYAVVGRWFESSPLERRHLIGKIVAVKRVDGGFYYRITSGVSGWDVAYEDVKHRVLSIEDE
jgi:hypothetical protein